MQPAIEIHHIDLPKPPQVEQDFKDGYVVRFDTKQEAMDFAGEHGGLVVKNTYADGSKPVDFFVFPNSFKNAKDVKLVYYYEAGVK